MLILSLADRAQTTTDNRYEKATRFFHERNLTAARREFTRLVDTAPPALKSRYFLGRIALLESKPAEAVTWLEPLVTADPPVFDAVAQLGKAYLDLGNLEKAKVLTERAINRAEWDGALHYRLGRIYQQMGQQDRARQEFSETVRLKSADRESVQLLLECSQHISKHELAEAIRIRDLLIANPSVDPDVLVAVGAAFAGAGMHQESLEAFVIAAKREPSFFQAHYNTGLALLNLGRPSDAIPSLEASLRLGPDSVDANSALSVAYVLTGRYTDALPTLEHWRRIQPENPRAAMMLALAYLRGGSPAKSVPLLEQLVRASSDAKAHFLLIEALNATEQQARALETANQAVQMFPDNAQAHLARAQQLARLGRYGEASPEFTRTLELAPGQTDAMLGLGEVQQKAGDYATSLVTYQRALSVDANNVAATLGAARSLILLQRIGEARNLLESSSAAHPENSQVHYELSRVYARLGERELAAQQTRIMLELRARESKAP